MKVILASLLSVTLGVENLDFSKYEAEAQRVATKYDVSEYFNSRWCKCPADHQFCNFGDRHCYKSDAKWQDFSTSTCAGRCTADQSTNKIRHGISETRVAKSVSDVAIAMRDAWEVVNETKLYLYWITHEARTPAYSKKISEEIKVKGFQDVDMKRLQVEVNLSHKVTAVSALSSRLASEAGGGSTEEQDYLSHLLASVEADRARLSSYGLERKFEAMRKVERERMDDEQRRLQRLRDRALSTRLAFINAARLSQDLLKQWDPHRESEHESDYDRQEGVFDSMEQISERYTDSAKDGVGNAYGLIHEAVSKRVELLRKVASKDAAKFFDYGMGFETIYS